MYAVELTAVGIPLLRGMHCSRERHNGKSQYGITVDLACMVSLSRGVYSLNAL